MKEAILKEFESGNAAFEGFREKIQSLCSELLKNHIRVLQISGRVKDRDSLGKKLDRKSGKYTKISDITDIIGIRIITYLNSDVDKVAKIIENEFLIDRKNSVDKRKLNNNEFGYRSLHYVVGLNESRVALTENKSYSSFQAEVQIRSILQHAWAEIEHDLGYKSSIPDEFKRGFNRLSALLETADIEFDRLVGELIGYEKSVPSLIKYNPKGVELNRASLLSFNRTNQVLVLALQIVKRGTKVEFYADGPINLIEPFVEDLGVKTIDRLQTMLDADSNMFYHFVYFFTRNNDGQTSLPFSFSAFCYLLFLLAKKGDIRLLNKYFGYSNDEEPRELVTSILTFYDKAVKYADQKFKIE